MQGSWSFSVESVITTALGKVGRLLILTNGENGEYGKRIAQIAQINHVCINIQENRIITPEIMNEALQDSTITHVVFVHCETTTGILNPLEELCRVVKTHNNVLIIDAMSSFGGIPIDIEKLEIDF